MSPKIQNIYGINKKLFYISASQELMLRPILPTFYPRPTSVDQQTPIMTVHKRE